MPDAENEIPEKHRPCTLHLTDVRTVHLGHTRQLRIAIADSAERRTIALLSYRTRERGGPLRPDRPVYIFPENLPALIAALTEAAVALDVRPD